MTTQPAWPRRLLNAVAVDYALFLIGLSIIHLIWPQRAGVLAVTQIFAPYLFAPLLVLAPLAWRRAPRLLPVAILICAGLFVLRFPPHLNAAALSPAPVAGQFTAMTWNVAVGGQQDAVRAVLLRRPADIIALQETHTEWIAQDAAITARYPHRQALPPWDASGISGMMLLSRYPILEQGVLDQPADLWPQPDVMWARLDLGGGATLRVVTAHPRPARLSRAPCLSRVCYDPSRRDAQLANIRAFVGRALARGERLLLLGDFNVTDREPAYHDLAAGLQDAYMAVGTGAANTWAPGDVMRHGLALLRIDYLFTSPTIRPLRLAVDCTPRGSDHCILYGTFVSNEQ